MSPLRVPFKEYRLGRTTIAMTPEHSLDRFRRDWPRLQMSIGDVARLVGEKYPGFSAIDIGANIGDTAAVMCTHADVPILCVEGNPVFLPFLEENARRIGQQIAIERSFVGNVGGSRRMRLEFDPNGTTKLVASEDGQEIAFKSLDDILMAHPRFRDSRLVKTDIDGLDFAVIAGAADVLRAMRPILFFEYAPMDSETGCGDGLDCFRQLTDLGYTQFMVWDGYGHYMISLGTDDFDKMVDLTFFLVANRRFGAAIYHYDICAFPAADVELFQTLRKQQLALCLG